MSLKTIAKLIINISHKKSAIPFPVESSADYIKPSYINITGYNTENAALVKNQSEKEKPSSNTSRHASTTSGSKSFPLPLRISSRAD